MNKDLKDGEFECWIWYGVYKKKLSKSFLSHSTCLTGIRFLKCLKSSSRSSLLFYTWEKFRRKEWILPPFKCFKSKAVGYIRLKRVSMDKNVPEMKGRIKEPVTHMLNKTTLEERFLEFFVHKNFSESLFHWFPWSRGSVIHRTGFQLWRLCLRFWMFEF